MAFLRPMTMKQVALKERRLARQRNINFAAYDSLPAGLNPKSVPHLVVSTIMSTRYRPPKGSGRMRLSTKTGGFPLQTPILWAFCIKIGACVLQKKV